MARKLLRAWLARITVVAAALAIPLLAVGTARASIAGAPHGVTQDVPDLVSANTVSSNEVIACYDKTLNSGISPGDFDLRGYAAGVYQPPTFGGHIDGTNDHCVDLFWNTSIIGDINQYTVLTDFGGVTAKSTGLQSEEDSTTLSIPNALGTHNGTAGLTTAPNLVGAGSPLSSQNTLVFVFDKAVDPTSLFENEFEIWNGSAIRCFATNAAIQAGTNDQDVVVTFSKGCMSVQDAVLAGVFNDGSDTVTGFVRAASNTNSYSPLQVVPATGTNAANGGVTSAPDLTNAQLDPGNPDAIDYTFDKHVVVADKSDFCFAPATGVNPNVPGGRNCAVSATIANPPTDTVVRATFNGDLSKYIEYAVQAYVFNEAVSAENSPFENNTDGSHAVGDNAGAFARGFTTAPDVFLVTFNQAAETATVSVDQRVCGGCVNPDDFKLKSNVDDTTVDSGLLVGGSGGPVANPTQLTVTFPGDTNFANASNLWFADCDAMWTALADNNSTHGCDGFNVVQIVHGTTTAALLRTARYLNRHTSARAWRRGAIRHRIGHASRH
jgi:hypothetical protein